MFRRHFSALGAALIVVAALAGCAQPQVGGVPAAVATADATGIRQLDWLHTYDQLTRELKRIEAESAGRVRVVSIGKTLEGRDVWFATVGTGLRRLLFLTQQHGNEPLPTEAALFLLDRLSTAPAGSNDAWLLTKVTLGIVVRANPDGSEVYHRWNVDPLAPAIAGAREGVGYDVNRWHAPMWDARLDENPVREARAIIATYHSFQPELVVDYHHQGDFIHDSTGQLVDMSIFWPTAPGISDAVRQQSQRVNVVIYDAVRAAGGVVTQYPGGDFEGIARNAYGLRGSASVLVEHRRNVEQAHEWLTWNSKVSMLSIMQAYADGSIHRIDPDRAWDIPDRGDRFELPVDQYH